MQNYEYNSTLNDDIQCDIKERETKKKELVLDDDVVMIAQLIIYRNGDVMYKYSAIPDSINKSNLCSYLIKSLEKAFFGLKTHLINKNRGKVK